VRTEPKDGYGGGVKKCGRANIEMKIKDAVEISSIEKPKTGRGQCGRGRNLVVKRNPRPMKW